MQYRCKITQGHLSYERAGQGEPVLLIMGYLARGKGWRRQFNELSRFYDTVYFDHRGIGESSENPALSMEELASDILELMDHLHWEKAHIIGISMGGMIAQTFAHLAQDRCLTLTLIATHAGGKLGRRILPTLKGLPLFLKSNFSRHLDDKYFALAQLLLTPSYLSSLSIHPNMSMQERKSNEAWLEIYENLSEDFSPKPKFKTQIAHLWAILKHKQALTNILLPTLVIQPQNDLLIHPKHSVHLSNALPNVTLKTVTDAGHGLIRQKPDIINQLLIEHLQNHRIEHRSTP